MRKGEIACYNQFLLFSQCFQDLISLVHQNAILCGNGLNLVDHEFSTSFSQEKGREWLKDKVEDEYDFIPISKPDQTGPSLPKDHTDALEKMSAEKRLTTAFTKFFSLQSETEKLKTLLGKRLGEGQTEAMKYKILKEFEPMFTDTFIAAKIVSADVDDIMTVISDEQSVGLIKELKSDVGKLVDQLDKTLSDIQKSMQDLSRGSMKK